MAQNENSLVDKFGRTVDYVRLSVTDRCDFRCVYCMTEDMTFLPRKQILSLEEIYQIALAFTELGVKKIRLTGGEPMVRSDVMSLIGKLGSLPGLEELLLTTNGAQLQKFAPLLKEAGLNRINITTERVICKGNYFIFIVATHNYRIQFYPIKPCLSGGINTC